MAKIIVKGGGSFERQLPPEGNHAAICYKIISSGTVRDEKFQKDKKRVSIYWELPQETAVFKEGEPAKPFTVKKNYTLSLHEQSRLRKDLESWRNKRFTDKELEGFDIAKLIGAKCMVSVSHSEDSKYANVMSISTVPKGYDIGEQTNPPLIFSIDEFDQKVFDQLLEWEKDDVKKSFEYKKMFDDSPIDGDSDDGGNEPEDDLPF
jgi:hypothetical protein